MTKREELLAMTLADAIGTLEALISFVRSDIPQTAAEASERVESYREVLYGDN